MNNGTPTKASPTPIKKANMATVTPTQFKAEEFVSFEKPRDCMEVEILKKQLARAQQDNTNLKEENERIHRQKDEISCDLEDAMALIAKMNSPQPQEE